MKILIAADTYFPHVNGASYFAQRLAHNLAVHGHQVAVIAPSESFDYTRTTTDGVSLFGVRSLPIFFYKGFRFCMPFLSNNRIEKIVLDFKPDVIHLQAHFSVCRAVLRAAKRNSIPVVATNHFMPENLVHYLPFSTIVGPPLKKIAWADFGRIFNKVGQITSPTQIAADLVQPHFKKPLIPLSNGIDMTIFKPENNGQYLKERFHLDNRPILLYVGRLDREKNLDVVIRSFADAKKIVDIQLVIAGTGAEKSNLENLSLALDMKNAITFAGFVPDKDLPYLYTIADVFIIAGTAELQSIVTMEAMASGLPVLAADAVALPELVSNGDNGFLFDVNDEPDVTQKIITIFSDEKLRTHMSTRSFEKIKKHDIKNTIKQFEEIYTREIATTHAK